MDPQNEPSPARPLRAKSPVPPRAIGLACLVAATFGMRAMIAAQSSGPDWLPWITTGLATLSALYAVSFALVLLRVLRFGRPTLTLADPEFQRGSWLQGTLRVPRSLRSERGLTAHLTCLETTTNRGSSGDRSTSTGVVWQNTAHLSAEAWTVEPDATLADLAFWIPADARVASSKSRTRDGVRWFVTVDAPRVGANLNARFLVPIPEATTGVEDPTPAPELPGRLAPDELLGASRLRLVQSETGIELHTPMLASPKMALAVGLFAAIFSTATWIMVSSGAPILLYLVFAAFSLLTVLITVQSIFGRGHLFFDEDELHYAYGIPGLQSTGRIDWASLTEIAIKDGGRVGETMLFELSAERASGKPLGLVRDLPDRPTAEALALFIEAQRGDAA